ncbi:MAG: aminopeptidase P family protein [Deltaproteobacteria bacterium]|nr:aminopeptidase P family protein [Deltaproteobacteria bacterium]
MALTEKERERRHQAIHRILEREQLNALLLIGDTNVGHGFYGDHRYYTNNRIIFYRQAVIVLRDSAPVLFAGSDIQREAATRRSFVKDCRLIQQDLSAEVTKLLMERGVTEGRVGANLEMLSTAFYLYLKKELPGVEWVETHPQIMDIRNHHGEEELAIFRRGASLGDGGYQAALNMIRPGVSEYEIAAEIEYDARVHGAEEHFTLIGSGNFSFGNSHTLPLPYSPSPRRMEMGDSIVMEITPRYEGYWTQLVRTANVGRPNRDLMKIHEICIGAIEKGIPALKPGNRVKEVVLAMESSVKISGFLLRPPLGHLCGIDLVEARVSAQNETVLKPGTAFILHPTIVTPDGKRSFFWGETYLITDHGHERLHHSGDELQTV